DAWCARVERLLHEVVDPRTGDAVVAGVERVGSAGGTPQACGDLVVRWKAPTFAFAHPELGVIGPFPMRRTGGHEDPIGFAFVAGPGVAAADLGINDASSFAATVSALLGGAGREVSGEPLVRPVVRSG